MNAWHNDRFVNWQLVLDFDTNPWIACSFQIYNYVTNYVTM
jgi:hypothetical protein